MNNVSQRSPPLPDFPPASPHRRTRLGLLAISVFAFFALLLPPPLSLSLSLSLEARVAFRNLFVIKAAIYFTLIEKIGRLPLPATIYHDRTRSRPPLFFAFSPPQKIIMPDDVCTGAV